MLESTNALIAALVATLRELRRSQLLLEGGGLSEAEEEELGPFVNQLHEALADLSEAYDGRRSEQPHLLSLEALRSRIEMESMRR